MEKVIVPTNLLLWPRVKNMLPDQKLIFMALWQNPQVSACGAYFLDLDVFAVSLGFARPNLEEAIADFEAKNLVVFDKETSEIMINDWWRFHKCQTGIQEKLVQQSVDKIESMHIRKSFFDKIKHVSIKINDLRINTTEPNFNSTQPQPSAEAEDEPAAQGSSGGDLKFPKSLHEGLRVSVSKMIGHLPNAQILLDEVGARLEDKNLPPVRDPLAFLNSILQNGLRRTPAGLAKTNQRMQSGQA